MSPWAFARKSKSEKSFFSAGLVFGGHPARLRRKVPACSFKIFLGASVPGISRSRNQSAYALRVLNVFGQASREVLAARSGLAVRKVTQLGLRHLKFRGATLQANE